MLIELQTCFVIGASAHWFDAQPYLYDIHFQIQQYGKGLQDSCTEFQNGSHYLEIGSTV